MVHAKSGQVRGNHYHEIAHEWFTVFEGNAVCYLKDMKTQERVEVLLSANEAITLHVPPGIAHAFYAAPLESFSMIAYSSIVYDSNDTIRSILK